MPPVSELARSGAEAIVGCVLRGMEPRILERHPAEYRCYCSRERVQRAIESIGVEALDDMARSGEGAEVSCQFCDAVYRFTPEEVDKMAEKARDAIKNEKDEK